MSETPQEQETLGLACTHAGPWPVHEGSCLMCFLAMEAERNLLAARVEAVLALHVARYGWCIECSRLAGEYEAWPCPTRRALEGQLAQSEETYRSVSIESRKEGKP